MPTEPAASARPRWGGRLALNLAVLALAAFWTTRVAGVSGWARVAVGVALALWLARAVLDAARAHRGRPTGRADLALATGTALTGALAASASDGVGSLVAAVALAVVVGSPAVPSAAATVVGLLTVAALGVGAVLSPLSLVAFLSLLAGLALGSLAGLSTRQSRSAQRQRVLVHAQEVALRDEAARVALARDLHDVLAHSLGGIVVQLDAVQAQLEAGDVGPATERVGRARELAAGGLRDARGAVAALRDPAARGLAGPTTTLVDAVRDLVVAERSLGATVGLRTTPPGSTGAGLPAAVTTALVRATQEALTNARSHAPGTRVEVALRTGPDDVRLTVTNPLPAEPGDGGVGGFGLRGIRERVGALASGATASAGPVDESFVLDVVVPLGAGQGDR
ncbi:sensor histidine kinase [Luteimicrobium sp. NPDC057192]|uniref:sensor histidine kinase n=1 Tax=Luteimicrobium sp. NPDC057192 TaxID=3346042 RepID=UPI0036433A6F